MLFLHPGLPYIPFLRRSLSGFNLLLVVLFECVHVGLNDDVHERFEETEDQPAVDHLDVGGVGQIAVDTDKKLSDLSLSLYVYKIFS